MYQTRFGCCFFFQAEDGIRDLYVTGVQTCALPIFGFALVAGYTAVMVAGAAAAGLGLVLLNVQSAYSVPLASRLALGRVTALELIRQGATLALTAALVAAGAGLFGYLSITVPVSALVVVLSAAWVRGLIPLRPAADRAG